MVGIIFGVIFLIIAVVLFFGKKSSQSRLAQLAGAGKQKLGELLPILEETKASLSDLGSDNTVEQSVTVMGMPKCAQPLMSPIGNVPCIYYRYKVTNKWTERYQDKDSNGNTVTRTRTHEDVIDQGENSAVFTLDDGTGAIEVDPHNGQFEDLHKTVDRSETQFQNTNNGPSIQLGSLRIDLGGGNMSRMGGMSSMNNRPESVKYIEEVIGMDRNITVVGAVTDNMGNLRIASVTKNKVIISTKSADELVANAQSSIKNKGIAMIACGVIGLVCILLGIIL